MLPYVTVFLALAYCIGLLEANIAVITSAQELSDKQLDIIQRVFKKTSSSSLVGVVNNENKYGHVSSISYEKRSIVRYEELADVVNTIARSTLVPFSRPELIRPERDPANTEKEDHQLIGSSQNGIFTFTYLSYMPTDATYDWFYLNAIQVKGECSLFPNQEVWQETRGSFLRDKSYVTIKDVPRGMTVQDLENCWNMVLMRLTAPGNLPALPPPPQGKFQYHPHKGL